MEWNNVPGLKEAAMVAINLGNWEHVKTLLEAAVPKTSIEHKQLLEILQTGNRNEDTNIVAESCYRGYVELVQVFLNSGFPPNHIVTVCSRTMLHCATYGGHLPLMKLLKNCGADIYSETHFKESPLHIAVQYGHLEIVKYLVSVGADINTCDIGSALFRATLICNDVTEDLLQLLLDLGYDQNTDSWILFRGSHNNMKIIQKLLDAGVHVNGRDGNIPLHEAARNGNIPVMQLLLDYGADVNARDKFGDTVLHKIVLSAKLQSVKFLIKRCNLINSVNNNQETPLLVSVYCRQFDIAMLLINSGADLDLGIHRDVLLHRAIRADAPVELIECLLEKGGNVTTLFNNLTTLQYVIFYDWEISEDTKLKIAKLLLIYGSNHYVEDDHGNTVLHWACEMGDVQLVEYLIDYGLNVDAKNSQGEKPCDIAIVKGHTNIVKAITHYYCNKYTKF